MGVRGERRGRRRFGRRLLLRRGWAFLLCSRVQGECDYLCSGAAIVYVSLYHCSRRKCIYQWLLTFGLNIDLVV